MPSNPPAVPDGTIPSPNIWYHPSAYELENTGVDPDGVIEAAMADQGGYQGAVLLDIGCGSGYHLPGFAERATRVIGVEPHPGLLAAARRRTGRWDNIVLHAGTAQQLPVPDHSVDVAHARWAYFFGAGCEPGLAELERVMRSGGVAFVIDNDPSRSTFGGWLATAYPDRDGAAIDAFFADRGWTNLRRTIRWSFSTRAELAEVLRIEFDRDHAEAFLAEHSGTDVDYAIVVRVRRF